MEGPTVRAIADKMSGFREKEVLSASGNTKIEKQRAEGEKVRAIFSRGKNLLIKFRDFSIRIHFLMYGSYRINEDREGMSPRLSLVFESGFVNFYNCSVKLLRNEEIDGLYPESLDITSPAWNLEKAMGLLVKAKEKVFCDILLDQDIFLGIGNIIKNEALFLSRTHPLSVPAGMSNEQAQRIVMKAREFSMQFYEIKKRDEALKPHLKIYQHRKCPVCKGKVTGKKTGERNRFSYFCPACQALYA